MTTLQYLTVQDVIWINNRITGRENEFDFMKLEEGAFYQYSYGAAQGVLFQAARFVVGLLKNRPFTDGNEGTAIASAVVFLSVNGYDVEVSDVRALMDSCSNDESALRAFEEIAKPTAGHGHASIVEAGEALMLRHVAALSALTPAAA